jgi:hypothetical protein
MAQPTLPQYRQQVVELVQRLEQALHFIGPHWSPYANTVEDENRSLSGVTVRG